MPPTPPPTMERGLNDDLTLMQPGCQGLESMSSDFPALCSFQDVTPSHQQDVRLGYRFNGQGKTMSLALDRLSLRCHRDIQLLDEKN